ncbi:hypothetical protein LIER_03687 [Lithospermum erythrorhizon]|uniref:Uncharacterized protein n=1 Tax=Lithospermum erythrorhizon TaxID=34254 RepID=A0AAV3NVQ6_LITER
MGRNGHAKYRGSGGSHKLEEGVEYCEVTWLGTASCTPLPEWGVGGSVLGSAKQNPIGRRPQRMDNGGDCLGRKLDGGHPSPSRRTELLDGQRPSSPQPSESPRIVGPTPRGNGWRRRP